MVPKIANKRKKRRAMTRALIMEGTALMRETTAIFSPSFLEIILSGRSTLNIRMTLMN